MLRINELAKGYCAVYGGEALFAATASHCREVNGCTKSDCPLERDGRRPETDVGLKVLSGPFSLLSMARRPERR